MLVVHVFGRLKLFLLGILALVRRAMCCFSRRRKRSNSECEILDSISVVQNDGNHSSAKNRNDVSICRPSNAIYWLKRIKTYSFRLRPQPERDWNSWDDSPRTVDEHIEQYRQKLAQPQNPSQEPAVDYFQVRMPDAHRSLVS